MSATVTTFQSLESARETYRLVRERIYQGPLDVLQILISLRMERVTGTISIDLSQGGICRVRFREEQDIRYSP